MRNVAVPAVGTGEVPELTAAWWKAHSGPTRIQP
jgi:hypothetical protein